MSFSGNSSIASGSYVGGGRGATDDGVRRGNSVKTRALPLVVRIRTGVFETLLEMVSNAGVYRPLLFALWAFGEAGRWGSGRGCARIGGAART